MHANIRFIVICYVWIVLLFPADGIFSRSNNRRSKDGNSPTTTGSNALTYGLTFGLPALYGLFFICLCLCGYCTKRRRTQTGAQGVNMQHNLDISARDMHHIRSSTNGPQQTPYGFQRNQQYDQCYHPHHQTHGLKYSGSPPAYWDIFRPGTPSRRQMRYSPYSINYM